MNWQDYPLEELRRQYLTNLTPGMGDHVRRYEELSEELVRSMPGELDVPYGPAGPRQTLDIFTPETGKAPVLIFIHGGYWYFNSKDPRRFPAKELIPRGIAWVPINYRLVPNVTMTEVVADVRNAVKWLYEHSADYGCDPERIYVSGNSAGGHLTAELISDDWPEQYGLPADVVKGACAISGLYDLEPLLECEPNEKLRLDLESARRYSPIHHLSRRPVPAIITCGANESAEFRRQTGSYAKRCEQAAYPVTHMEINGHDHFSIIGELANPESPLFQAVIEMIA
ncbi:MAG: alpha/beta hydrolase [Gammaproteobacteria bacterium]|nr:alpha/beta hydrolase [Gammaproteobacteria bacterium]